MQWHPVLSGINKTSHSHNEDKIKPRDLDSALTRSFHGDPLRDWRGQELGVNPWQPHQSGHKRNP